MAWSGVRCLVMSTILDTGVLGLPRNLSQLSGHCLPAAHHCWPGRASLSLGRLEAICLWLQSLLLLEESSPSFLHPVFRQDTPFCSCRRTGSCPDLRKGFPRRSCLQAERRLLPGGCQVVGCRAPLREAPVCPAGREAKGTLHTQPARHSHMGVRGVRCTLLELLAF